MFYPWAFFDIIEDGTKKIAKCKDCFAVVSCKIERLKVHGQKCPQIQQALSDSEVYTIDTTEAPKIELFSL